MIPIVLATLIFISQSYRVFAADTPSQSDVMEIRSAYDGLGVAFEGHQLDHFMEYFSADYTDEENGHRHDKPDTRHHFQDQMSQMKTVKTHYTLGTITPTAKGLLVEMQLHAAGTWERRVLFAKLHGHFTDDLSVRDLWVKTPSGWRLQHRQTLKDDLHTGR